MYFVNVMNIFHRYLLLMNYGVLVTRAGVTPELVTMKKRHSVTRVLMPSEVSPYPPEKKEFFPEPPVWT